ncbi:RNA polymerase sigma factor SigZ [Litoribacillus peritrichatus]|uniref:RNA polymerase sigma factor SigZ n=1 Tax=Litoribacillus peritrichatus TaxID=718191 RepID=A0ABP7MVV4_9GAMM
MNLEVVWSEYRESLKRFLLSKVSDPDEVEDLLQEVLIKTHKNLKTIKSEASIKSWLFQTANNAIIDFYRKNARSRNIQTEDLWYDDFDDDVKASLASCILPFINRLPDKEAQLLLAVEVNGQPQKEYAQSQGMSYSTLKSRVQKSRKNLRSLFDECCHFSIDASGNIFDFNPKDGHPRDSKCNKC